MFCVDIKISHLYLYETEQNTDLIGLKVYIHKARTCWSVTCVCMKKVKVLSCGSIIYLVLQCSLR